MKNLNFSMPMLVASALLIGSLVSCIKDDPKPVPEGDPTSVLIRMSFPAEEQGTRATSDPYATEDEAGIKTVDVFIYSSAGAFLSHTALTSADFTAAASTSTADVYESNSPIATTTGAKSFYVGVNMPAAAVTSLLNKSLSSAGTTVQIIVRADLDPSTEGLPMFSTSATRATLVADATSNSITANAKRMVAKVTVETDPAMTTEGVDGTLGDLTWAINNFNTKYYLLQGSAPTYADPNWSASSYLTGDFSQAASTDYVAVYKGVSGTTPAITDYTACYAPGNTSDEKTMKELTRVTVQSTFIPANWVASGAYTKGQDTAPTTTANSNTTPTDFYSVTPGVGQDTIYFQDNTDASNYAGDKGANVLTYTGGVCYWNIWLNKEGYGEIFRNDYYKCKITRIVTPGNPTDAVHAPNEQPQEDTSISVTIDPLFWNTPVSDDYDLVP